MNKSLCYSFIDEIIPWITFTNHIQPSPEIWFETEHFEILSFSGPGLKVPSVTSWAWNDSRAQFSRILEIFQVELESILGDEQTKKSFRKQRSLVFQSILLKNWVFAKIEAKLNWNCASKLR